MSHSPMSVSKLHTECCKAHLPLSTKCVDLGVLCVQGRRDGRSGDDSEGTREPASSPLHVLSDAAQKEGNPATHPAKRLAREGTKFHSSS